MRLLLERPGPFLTGRILERPNRFTLLIETDRGVERVHLPDPGALGTVLAPRRKVICERREGTGRKTRLTALAVRVGGIYVMVDSSLANPLFARALEGGLLPELRGHRILFREKEVKGGRLDFVLEGAGGERSYVEVKSCTHVERGVAKFPDRPTERGRRHLRLLRGLSRRGKRTCLFFVVQRPDARILRPFREVDPEFSRELRKAEEEGVLLGAFSIRFLPPRLYFWRRVRVETLPP